MIRYGTKMVDFMAVGTIEHYYESSCWKINPLLGRHGRTATRSGRIGISFRRCRHVLRCLGLVSRSAGLRTYGGPQVPTFVQRPGTPRRHHSHTRTTPLPHHTTFQHVVWCLREKSSAVSAWCRRGVPGARFTKYLTIYRKIILSLS